MLRTLVLLLATGRGGALQLSRLTRQDPCSLPTHAVPFAAAPINGILSLRLTNPLTRRRHTNPPSTCVVLYAVAPSNNLFGFGMPSNPGWKSGRLDRLTDWAESKEPNRPVICEYEPSGLWLWTRWKGTVIQATWRSVLLAICTGLLFDFWARRRLSGWRYTSWPLFCVPPADDPLIKGLAGLKKLWEYQITIGTFIVTFFTSQAFGYWQKVYNTSRAIQGRINDFCMLLVMGAARKPTLTQKGSSGYSDDSRRLVKLCTRLIRMSHIFFWAATPTASNGLNDCEKFIEDAANCPLPIDDEHIGPLLLSSYGLKALVNSGQLTQEEADSLMNSRLPPSQYAYVLLVWVGMHVMNGLEEGTLRGGNGFEENVLRQLTTLRASFFDIDDFRAGRMPLAYVQLMQVLVDSLVVIAPFALYSELGSLSTPLVGLLAFFFRGLLVLSKSFLDPFGVEGHEGQNIRVDVLVSELNFGAAKRWIKAGGFLPPPPN